MSKSNKYAPQTNSGNRQPERRHVKLTIDGETVWRWQPNDAVCTDCIANVLSRALATASNVIDDCKVEVQ